MGPRIKDLQNCIGERVTIKGWLYNKRTAGKLQFPIIRDGSGYLQCVISKKEVPEETWRAAEEARACNPRNQQSRHAPDVA